MVTTLQLPSQYLGGREFFRLVDSRSLDTRGYFLCLKYLRSLFQNAKFKDLTPGFYINFITIPDDNGNGVRLQYYTINPTLTLQLIFDFIFKNKDRLSIFKSKETFRPDLNQPLEEPDEKGYKFQNFLNTNTQIVLDVLENYGEHSLQKLVYDYRYIHLPQRTPPEVIFESVFIQHSNFFRELKKQNLSKEYWQGLTYMFNGVDYGLHFLVNIAAIQESPYDPRFFEETWIIH